LAALADEEALPAAPDSLPDEEALPCDKVMRTPNGAHAAVVAFHGDAS